MILTLVIVLMVCAISSASPISAEPFNDWLDDFVAGDPLIEEEFHAADMSSLSRESGDDEFIPWDKQDPELLEGDIMPSDQKNANPNRLWPDKTIPYTVSASYSSAQLQVIKNVMAMYQKNTCLRFVPRTNQKNYISIYKSGRGCWSFVGLQEGKQGLSLDDGCISSRSSGTVIHELMHAAGFWHEHTRQDRDTYVSINLNNVDPTKRRNFDMSPRTHSTTFGLAYDYGSVMHYPKYAFAIDRSKPVITAKIGNPVLGQRKKFSSLDLKKLNKLYNCPSSG